MLLNQWRNKDGFEKFLAELKIDAISLGKQVVLNIIQGSNTTDAEIQDYYIKSRINIIRDTVKKHFANAPLNILICLKMMIKNRERKDTVTKYDWDVYKDIFLLNSKLNDSCSKIVTQFISSSLKDKTNDKRFSKDYNKALMYRAEMLKNVLKGCRGVPKKLYLEKIKFGPNSNPADVRISSLKFLYEVCVKLKLPELYISNTSRNPYNQARVMFEDLYGGSPDDYAEAGTTVQQVYYNKTSGLSKEEISEKRIEIIEAMRLKIIEVVPINVSKHASNPDVLTVVDIPLRFVDDYDKADELVELLENYKNNGWFDKLLYPGNNVKENAYHLQINVK